MSSVSHVCGVKANDTPNATSTGASAKAVRRIVVEVKKRRLVASAFSRGRPWGRAGTE